MNLRLWMLPKKPTTVVTADAPGIYPNLPRASYVLARRHSATDDLRSTFAAVIDPYGEQPTVKSLTDAQSLPRTSTWPVMMAIDLGDDRIDYILAGEGFAKVSTKGEEVQSMTLSHAGSVTFRGRTLKLGQSSLAGSIARIDDANHVIYTTARFPDSTSLSGEFLSIGNAAYSHRSAYRIESVSRVNDETAIKLAPTSFVIGRAHIDQAPPDQATLPNVIPLEYAKSVGRKASGFYSGKTIATPDGRVRTTITDILAPDGETIKVQKSDGFKAGDDAVIYDIQPGDDFTVTCWGQATRDAQGKWTVSSNAAQPSKIEFADAR